MFAFRDFVDGGDSDSRKRGDRFGLYVGQVHRVVVGLDRDNGSLCLAAVCGRSCGGQEAAVESTSLYGPTRATRREWGGQR